MNTVSKTAIWSTMARAVGSREPDPQARNPDFMAERLIGAEERILLGDHPLALALARSYNEALMNPEVVNAVGVLITRTRFVDERLERAMLGGATQVVILGAGFDTRAYRFRELLASAQVYEVDHAATQNHKKRRMRETLGACPLNLSLVAHDFLHDDLNLSLRRAGYKRERKTFFICEGVTMYLPGGVVQAILRWIGTNAPSESSLVFDYTYETVIQIIDRLDTYPLFQDVKATTEHFKQLVASEPWIFGIPDRGERGFLKRFGLNLCKVMALDSDEAVRTYLTHADGSLFANGTGPKHQGCMILEAVVP